jgi:hypothetical protein
MNKKNKCIRLLFCLCSIIACFSCNETINNYENISEIPNIFPDYIEVCIPSTIAPLNFKFIDYDYEKLYVDVKGGKTGYFSLFSSNHVIFPKEKWKDLLSQNKGDKILITLFVKSNGKWKKYAPFSVYISNNPIDYGLVYRLIPPGYEVYGKMGIYERELSSFKQKPLIENTLITGSCINCHSFNQGNPDNMSMHIRGSHGGTLLRAGSYTKPILINTKTDDNISACVYPYWHPSGRFVAYSVNKTQQAFHSISEELIEVLDLASDIVIYDVETNKFLDCNILKTSGYETFPSFSPDGRSLYFCLANEQKLPEDYKQIRYNLCRISFDPENKTFGSSIDTLVYAENYNKSVSFPRPSFDGKYIMYTLLDYGNFGIWHQEADLYLLDISTGITRKLDEVNSDYAESYHNWSSNSRWFVFGSRRIDGLYTRPYIASIDEDGNIGKPFLLPQKNPESYNASLYSYNIPEFVTKPVELDVNDIEKKMLSPNRINVNQE